MVEGTYTKEDICKILGFDEKQFQDFLENSVEIARPKDIFTFTELMMLKKIKNLNSMIDALLVDPPTNE